MARLIDADAVLDKLKRFEADSHIVSGVIKLIDRQPTIDAEPVRHGRWIVQKVDDIRTKFYCSECERCVWCGNDYFIKPTEYVAHVYPYCHCGAKMNGGAE